MSAGADLEAVWRARSLVRRRATVNTTLAVFTPHPGERLRFEGSPALRKRLLTKASGRVSGRFHYGQIEIECGGQISGDVQAQPAGEPREFTGIM